MQATTLSLDPCILLNLFPHPLRQSNEDQGADTYMASVNNLFKYYYSFQILPLFRFERLSMILIILLPLRNFGNLNKVNMQDSRNTRAFILLQQKAQGTDRLVPGARPYSFVECTSYNFRPSFPGILPL